MVYIRLLHPSVPYRIRSVLFFFTERSTEQRAGKTGPYHAPYQYGTEYGTARKLTLSRAVLVNNGTEKGRFVAVPFSVPYPTEEYGTVGLSTERTEHGTVAFAEVYLVYIYTPEKFLHDPLRSSGRRD